MYFRVLPLDDTSNLAMGLEPTSRSPNEVTLINQQAKSEWLEQIKTVF